MNNEPPIERPSPLTFDLDQWRRDIQTFAEETRFELQHIITELSGDSSFYSNSAFSTPYISNTNDSEPSEASNQRLTSLKEKLAQRITSPNQ